MTPTPTTSTANAEKHAKILEAARKRMMHYGVSKTTMSEIADDCEVAVGTLYLYFKNKDEIVLALAEACREEQEAFLQSILQNPEQTSAQKLEMFLVEKFRYITAFRTETPHGKTLIAYLVQHFPERLVLWEEQFEYAVKTILTQGVEQQEFAIDSLDEAARLIRLATLGFFQPPYVELPQFPPEENLVSLVRWIVQNYKRGAA